MKYFLTITVVVSTVLIFVYGDVDRGKGPNVLSGLSTLAPPVNESALPCDVQLMISANRIAEILEKLEEYKSQKRAMKVIMKQVLDLIIANIYHDDDEEEDDESKVVDNHLQNFKLDRKKRKVAEI
ncbi:unnamed protein product [Chironomus riparius]|uniref:Uncharacterized protein n=1 Tax=Chironomus riparius TaxID=315576 RepID=A0A9P0IYP1_9DIPT|nr:unnamed protein product [Chironomus riparius]